MIYVTGDIHCPIDISKLNTKNFPIQRKMTKSDYLINVCLTAMNNVETPRKY